MITNFLLDYHLVKTLYVLFVRSILEKYAVVWHSSLSEENKRDLERVQKSAMKLILGDKYLNMKNRNTEKYQVQYAHAERFQKSPIIHMQHL